MIGPLKIGKVFVGGYVFGAEGPPDFPRIPSMVVIWPSGTYMVLIGGLSHRQPRVETAFIRSGRPTRSKTWFPPAPVRQRWFAQRVALAKARARAAA